MFEYRLSSDFDTSVAGNSLDAENEVFSRAIEVGAKVRVNVNISVTRTILISFSSSKSCRIFLLCVIVPVS